MIRKLTATVFVVLLAKCSLAQEAFNDTTQYKQGIRAAINSYFQFINDGAGIYNGVEHPSYPYQIEGFSYYKLDEWQNATIQYKGVVYNNVPAKYDLVKDQVIVKHPTGLGLGLYSPWVTYFIIGGDRFEYLSDTQSKEVPAPGFYQLLRTGTLSALAKRRKLIEEEIDGQEIKKRIVSLNRFYLLKEGVYYSPGTEASLLALMKERKGEAKKALRKEKIRFRKAPELAIITLVDLYNK